VSVESEELSAACAECGVVGSGVILGVGLFVMTKLGLAVSLGER